MISFSDFVSRIEYYEKRSEGTGISERDEREREASSSSGGKREKEVRAAFEDPLRFLSLFFEERRKKRRGRRGSNIYS